MQIDEKAFQELKATTLSLSRAVGELKGEILALQDRLSSNPGDFGLVPINDVSAAGGPHAQTLRRMITSGAIPGIRIGRKYYIRRVDLEQLLTPKTAKP